MTLEIVLILYYVLYQLGNFILAHDVMDSKKFKELVNLTQRLTSISSQIWNNTFSRRNDTSEIRCL